MKNNVHNLNYCEYCEANSSCLCFECLEYYCDDCFKMIHSKQKKSKHKKELIDPYIPIDLKCPEHQKVPNNLLCLDEKELCCSYCYYENLHSNHKILPITDVESIKKENLSIEFSKAEFDEINKKIIELKNKIEKEINNINILFDKTLEDLTKSFEEKISNLKKTENDIKEKLQNEVTKFKEKLEIYLSDINNQIVMNEKINKGIQKFDKNEKNMIKILSYISKINKNKKNVNSLLNKKIKSIKFSYIPEKSDINFDEFYIGGGFLLKKIEKGNCEVNFGGCQGRILFDIKSNKVYYINDFINDQIYVYNNYDDFKLKKQENSIRISTKISSCYSVIHKGYFYCFENKQKSTNNLIKYDLNQNKIIIQKNILEDSLLDNNQNCWGGYNDIILISDDNNLYAIYASNNNNKRISIALLEENNLNVIKIWNTDSLEKKKCGPIFMINGILYHISSYCNPNDNVIYSYDLNKGKSNKINIPFENIGGYDSSLTYYSHINCLMTVNNGKIYKYKVVLE